MEYLNDLQSREIRNSTIRRESGFFSIEIQQLLFLSRIDFQHNLPFKNWKFIIIIHTGRTDHFRQKFSLSSELIFSEAQCSQFSHGPCHVEYQFSKDP